MSTFEAGSITKSLTLKSISCKTYAQAEKLDLNLDSPRLKVKPDH